MKKLLLSVAAMSLLSLAAAPAFAATTANPPSSRAAVEPAAAGTPAKAEKKHVRKHGAHARKAEAKTPSAK
jgi:hypothetical protein